jgi:hypothetical protein
MEIIRFIWDANPSYDVYREFSKRHLFVPYKVQELIGARIKIEKREEQVRLWSISSRALRALQRVANEVERIINPPPEDNVVAIRSPARGRRTRRRAPGPRDSWTEGTPHIPPFPFSRNGAPCG